MFRRLSPDVLGDVAEREVDWVSDLVAGERGELSLVRCEDNGRYCRMGLPGFGESFLRSKLEHGQRIRNIVEHTCVSHHHSPVHISLYSWTSRASDVYTRHGV